MMADPSYEKINYSLRPGKSIERHMVLEICRRLGSFYRVNTYRYVGFGSPYFADFSLMHKQLGIQSMISIEQEVGDAPRMEFNKPYACIELLYGTSFAILPTLQWRDHPSIIWLDYDRPTLETILADISTVASQAHPGSLMVASMRGRASDFGGTPAERSEQLSQLVGSERTLGVPLTEFTDERFPKLLWQWIDEEIRQAVASRSGGMPPGLEFRYEQLAHFHHRDGVRIVTIGGLIYQEAQSAAKDHCDFPALHFVRAGDEPYIIRVPLLTFKELRALDQLLPGEPSLESVPERDLRAYSEVYRFFPNYVEMEV